MLLPFFTILCAYDLSRGCAALYWNKFSREIDSIQKEQKLVNFNLNCAKNHVFMMIAKKKSN